MFQGFEVCTLSLACSCFREMPSMAGLILEDMFLGYRLLWYTGCLFHRLLCHLELGVQLLKGDAIDDVHRVERVAQRLGHLVAVRVPHHRVQVHLLEGHLACAKQQSSV